MKAAIFDVDGTLVDSVDLHTTAWQEAFHHFGHKIPFDKIREQIGKGGDQLLPVFLSQDEAHQKGDEIQEYRGNLFKRKFVSQVKSFPQVRFLFERLISDGWKVALASSAKGDELQTYKEIANISDLLHTEASSDDAEKSKPHPDIFLAAMKRLSQIPAGDCIVIGDSPYDAEAALKAGMRAVAVLCGGFPEPQLRHSGYEAVYASPADILTNYEQTVFYKERPSQT